MQDSRLRHIRDHLEAARDLIVEIVDDGPVYQGAVKDFHQLDAARQFTNSAIVYVGYATDPEVVQ